MSKRTNYGAVKHSTKKVAAALDREIVSGWRPRTVTTTATIYRGLHPSVPGGEGYRARICPTSTAKKIAKVGWKPDRMRCGSAYAASPTAAYKKATLDMLKKMK